MTIEKIIMSNSYKFEKWNQQMKEQIEVNYHLKDFDDKERDKIFYSTNELLFEISENFFRYGNFKDDWDTSKCYLNFGGQNLLLKSLKMNFTFDWGVDNDQFYLQSYLTHSENLRYMKDDFWEMMLGLSQYGDFKFVENAGLDSQQRIKFENKTSNVFRLIRNYILFQVDDSADNRRHSDLDLGWFEIRWNFGTDWAKVLENSCKAFKDLYRLNYQLWKITDLKNKKSLSTISEGSPVRK